MLAVLRAMFVVTARRVRRGPLFPGWRWRMEVIGHALRAEGRKTTRAPIDRVRGRLPPAPIPRSIARRVVLETGRVGGVPVETIRPREWTPRCPTVMYMHGGGYVMCSPKTHRELTARIAVASGARCVSLDYRLAPEHPCPAAIEDCVAAYRGLIDGGTRAGSIVVAGDSAGAGLALSMLLSLMAARDPLPRAGVMLSPWVDMSCAGESIDGNARYCYVQRAEIEHFARYYLAGRHPRDPLASPVHADLTGLPPLLLQTGTADALHSECRLLAERARAAGVDITLQIGEGMFHGWQAFARMLPESRPFIEAIGQFIKTHAGEP